MGARRAKAVAKTPGDPLGSNSTFEVHYRELTDDQVDAIRAILEPMVSEPRRDRIESVLAHRTRDVVLVLENIHSDHNSAAVLRTADAMGLTEVHHVSDAEDIRLSRRIALGSEKWLDTVRHPDPGSAARALRERGYSVWAATVHGDAKALCDLPEGPLALIFGNEHRGLSSDAVRSAEGAFRLPMHGFAESYNLSVAAAVALDHTVAARRASGHLSVLDPDDAARLRVAWYARSVRSAALLLEKESLPLPVLAWARYAMSDERP